MKRSEPLELLRERRPRHLELRLVRHLRERPPLSGQLRVELGQRLLARRVDEQRGGVVRELVAGRALHRPVRAQRLARLEDLLHPDPVDAVPAEALEVLARVGEPVRMVDPQAVDEAVADELQHLAVRLLEDRRILDAHARELADVEEAAVPARVRVPVEEPRAELRVAPEAVLLLGGRHVVRDDVEDRAEAVRVGRLAERAQLLLAAEIGRDARRVDDVVAVHRAGPRLQHGREVEVRDAEIPHVGEDDLAHAPEAELGRELDAEGAAEVDHRRSDSPQQDERVLLHREKRARAERPLRRVAGRELDLPARAEAPRRQREHDRLRMRVEDRAGTTRRRSARRAVSARGSPGR